MRTVMIVGPLTDDDLKEIILAMQRVEGRRPDETFHVLVDSPETTEQAAEFVERVNPLRAGYGRLEMVWRRR